MDLVSDLMISGLINDCFIADHVLTVFSIYFLLISIYGMSEITFGRQESFVAELEHWNFTNKIRHRIHPVKLYFLRLSLIIAILKVTYMSCKNYYQTNVCMCFKVNDHGWPN